MPSLLPFLQALFQFGALNLVILGCTLIVFGVLYSVIRLARVNVRAGLPVVLIALLGSAAFCTASAVAALRGELDPRLVVTAFVVGLVTAVFGWLFTFRERKFPEYRPGSSYGLLFLGVGLFIAFATAFVPVIPTQFVLPTPTRFITSTPTATRTLPATRTPIVTATYTPVPSLTPTPTPIPSFTPAPSATPSPTLPQRPTSTSTPDPAISPTAVPPTAANTTAPRTCAVRIAAGVNLRAAPNPTARIVEVNAAVTVLQVARVSADGDWYEVRLNEGTTWVAVSVVIANGDCDRVPTAQP